MEIWKSSAAGQRQEGRNCDDKARLKKSKNCSSLDGGCDDDDGI